MDTTTEIPRLSPSIAGVVNDCPAKAWQQHRLLGNQRKDATPAMDEGKMFERLVTGYGLNELAVLPFDDWRTKAAKDARSDAIAAGLIPVKACDMEEQLEAARVIRAKMEAQTGVSFDAMQHQTRFEWESGGCACSGVLDCLIVRDDCAVIYDLKKTTSANPRDLQRTIIKYGYHVQHAAYIEAVEETYPQLVGQVHFRFLFYEVDAPYCVTVAQLDDKYAAMGSERWRQAKVRWIDCLAMDVWPEYGCSEYVDGAAVISPSRWDLLESGINFNDEI